MAGLTREQIAAKAEAVSGQVVGSGSMVFTTEEYAEYSKKNGRYMGRKEGQKTVLTPEEFIVLAGDGWTPNDMMLKHGIDLDELRAVARRVALIQQLQRPIVVTDKSIKF